jgi:hypothetical protein
MTTFVNWSNQVHSRSCINRKSWICGTGGAREAVLSLEQTQSSENQSPVLPGFQIRHVRKQLPITIQSAPGWQESEFGQWLCQLVTTSLFSIDVAQQFPYFNFLARLSSIACTEGLTCLSLRWIQPSQQHGRRIPSLSSLTVLLICSFRVSSFLTNVTQHIHSLRARGVRSSHIASAALSDVRAFRKSAGILCTTPDETVLLILLFYQTGRFRR